MNAISRDNFGRGPWNGAHKIFRLLLSAILIFPLALGIVSCNGDETEEDEPVIDPASGLYGLWESETIETTQTTDDGSKTTYRWNTTILFNSQNKIEGQITTVVGGPGNAAIARGFLNNTWYEVIDSNTIRVFRIYNGTRKECLLSYKLLGNNLILEYISGEKILLPTGENIIVFTNKIKGDIIEYPYGSWIATVSTWNDPAEYSVSFYMNGELEVRRKAPDESGRDLIVEHYRYDFSGNTLRLYKKDNTSTSPDCTLSFKTGDGNITFEYISGELPEFMAVFNSNKVSYSSR